MYIYIYIYIYMSTLRKYSFLFATLTQKYSQIVTILKSAFLQGNGPILS